MKDSKSNSADLFTKTVNQMVQASDLITKTVNQIVQASDLTTIC